MFVPRPLHCKGIGRFESSLGLEHFGGGRRQVDGMFFTKGIVFVEDWRGWKKGGVLAWVIDVGDILMFMMYCIYFLFYTVMGLVTLNRDGLISPGAGPPAWFFLHKAFGGEHKPFFPWMDIFTLFEERNAKTVKVHSIWICFFISDAAAWNKRKVKKTDVHNYIFLVKHSTISSITSTTHVLTDNGCNKSGRTNPWIVFGGMNKVQTKGFHFQRSHDELLEFSQISGTTFQVKVSSSSKIKCLTSRVLLVCFPNFTIQLGWCRCMNPPDFIGKQSAAPKKFGVPPSVEEFGTNLRRIMVYDETFMFVVF